jgi:hypothetical protein
MLQQSRRPLSLADQFGSSRLSSWNYFPGRHRYRNVSCTIMSHSTLVAADNAMCTCWQYSRDTVDDSDNAPSRNARPHGANGANAAPAGAIETKRRVHIVDRELLAIWTLCGGLGGRGKPSFGTIPSSAAASGDFVRFRFGAFSSLMAVSDTQKASSISV